MYLEKCAVIVAAYNEEKNIENCLKNILKQQYSNIEIIVVDDGSTDNTACIVLELKKLHHNIHYFFQDNRGAAAARMNGILHCSSDFITILDADDLMAEDAIASAMIMFEDEVDTVLYNFATSYNPQNTQFEYFKYYTEEKKVSGLAAFTNCLDRWGLHGLGVFRKAIVLKSYVDYQEYNVENKNFINNDEVITKFNFLNSRNIRRCDGVYFYSFNQNSTTKKANQNFYKILENTNILLKYCDFKNIKANHAKILLNDVKFIETKFKDWKKELSNSQEWKMALRENSKKILQNNKGQLSLRDYWKCLRLFLRTYR